MSAIDAKLLAIILKIALKMEIQHLRLIKVEEFPKLNDIKISV
jgi:hypothetical protein